MRDALRFLVCGDLEGGKSTLVERLLWENQQTYERPSEAIKKDLKLWREQPDDFFPALGATQTGSKQGIISEVACRYFATPNRRFLITDIPGHERYTSDVAAGASTSDLAVLVVNATDGPKPETYRHARIASMLGIRHLLIVVNKMDAVGWKQTVFSQIVDSFGGLKSTLGFDTFLAVPVSAVHGDNITKRSARTPWYEGRSLISYLEEVKGESAQRNRGFCMAVQWVNLTQSGFRGYCGRVSRGEVRLGDRVRIVPSGIESRVRAIYLGENQRMLATAGESVTICLDRKIEITRGSVIAAAAHPSEVSDQFEAKILCLSEQHLLAGRSYLFRLHTCEAVGTITAIKYKVELLTGTQLAANDLRQNDIGVVNLSLDCPVPFEPYDRHKRLGGFILVDRLSNRTVGAGMIQFALRRAANIHFQAMEIDKVARARQKHQKPLCLWFTGLPSSGKSTIANLLEKRLFAIGRHTYTLDGDNVRHGLNRDLGFSEGDRVENIRRVTEVARLMVDAGLVVVVSFISPFRAEREAARLRFGEGEFLEVFIDTPLDECERRDPKGLYAKARRGELANFTGIDSIYEPPVTPEIRLDTVKDSAEECVEHILGRLEAYVVKSQFEEFECAQG